MKTTESIKELAPLLVGHCWSPAPGASQYLVSDDGRVLSRVGRRPRILKPIRAGEYRAVQLVHDDGTFSKRYTHRLVLEAFRGNAPDGMEARHLDGDRFNNDIANLAWGTRRENHADKRRHGTAPRGERNPQAKLTREKVEQMRELYAAGGWTYKRLAAEFGVSTMTALRAVKGESWT
jgi:hypothetical protein